MQFWIDHDVEYGSKRADFLRYSYKEFVESVKGADSYTLWLAPGLHDQIMWAWLVQLFSLHGIKWENVQIKHLFNEQNSRFPYVGLGELWSDKFSLCQDFKMEKKHLDFLKLAYAALTHNTPELLLDICNEKDCVLPEFQKGLKSYLMLFPDCKSGLNAIDEAMLSGCKDGQLKSARIVAEGMTSEAYSNQLAISDSYIFSRLVKMTQFHSKYPLVHMHGTVKNVSSMRYTEVSITDLGKEVLSGMKNYVELNGINERIGGVHLSSQDNETLWFYKEGNLIRA